MLTFTLAALRARPATGASQALASAWNHSGPLSAAADIDPPSPSRPARSLATTSAASLPAWSTGPGLLTTVSGKREEGLTRLAARPNLGDYARRAVRARRWCPHLFSTSASLTRLVSLSQFAAAPLAPTLRTTQFTSTSAALAAAAPSPSPRSPTETAAAEASSAAAAAAAALLFRESWSRLEAKHGSRLIAPKEIVWLNGAPGSGKGANTPFILQSRSLSRSITMSDLLETSPALKARIDAGDLLPDSLVCDALLDAIFNPETADGAGVLIDGFPRTATQVDLLKCLYDKLSALSKSAAGGPDEWRFPRPAFRVVVLYVDEEESVRRQMARARLAALHNARTLDAGSGDLVKERPTDTDVAKCKRRFEVFRTHYSTCLKLQRFFPFTLIDALGSLEDTRAQIARELRYQSSLDLDESTYAAIRHLPLAADLVREARQALVASLDRAHARHSKIFGRVLQEIDLEVLPLLKRCALAGHAEWRTRSSLFASPVACKILIDVLTDRGFAVSYTPREVITPVKVDLTTGAIESERVVIHAFRLSFERASVREAAATALPLAPTSAETAGSVIGGTEVPDHLDASVRDTRKPRGSLHDPVLWEEAEEVEGGGSGSTATSTAAPGGG